MFLNWNFKRDYIKSLFIQKLSQVYWQIFVSSKLHPDIYLWLFLNVPNHRTKLKVFFNCRSLRDLKAHRKISGVRDCQLFSINVIKKANLKIIYRLFNFNRHPDALTFEKNINRRGIEKVLCIKLKVKSKLAKVSRAKFDVYYLFTISIYLYHSFKLKLFHHLLNWRMRLIDLESIFGFEYNLCRKRTFIFDH